MDIQTIIVALIGGGIVGFAQFMIQRHDSKNDRIHDVMVTIQQLNDSINQLSSNVDDRMDELSNSIRKVEEKGDERDAVSARVRILRFADDLRFAESQNRKFSKDNWDQCQSDITTYNGYCSDHPKFKNNQTVATVEFIDKGYRERLETNNFL